MATKKTLVRKKKLNQAILSVREKGSVQGVLGEMAKLTTLEGQVLQSRYGTDLETFELTNQDSGEIEKFWLDGGLRGAFKMAKVKPGMLVEIVHTGEKDIDEGTVQTYDVYELE